MKERPAGQQTHAPGVATFSSTASAVGNTQDSPKAAASAAASTNEDTCGAAATAGLAVTPLAATAARRAAAAAATAAGLVCAGFGGAGGGGAGLPAAPFAAAAPPLRGAARVVPLLGFRTRGVYGAPGAASPRVAFASCACRPGSGGALGAGKRRG